MKELHNHIFSNTTCISKETMLRYINKQLSKKELYEVEKHMLDCELCTDAFEGMKMATNSSILFAIDNKIDLRTGGGAKKSSIMRNLMVAASVAVIAFGAYFTVNNFNKNLDETNLAVNKLAPLTEKKSPENFINSNTVVEESNDQTVVLKGGIDDDEVALTNVAEPNESDFVLAEKTTTLETVEELKLKTEDIVLLDEVAADEMEEVVLAEPTMPANERLDNNNTAGNTATRAEAYNGVEMNDVSTVAIQKKDKKRNKKKYRYNKTKTTAAKASAPPQMENVADAYEPDNTYDLYTYKVYDYTTEYQNDYEFKKLAEQEVMSSDFENEMDKDLAKEEVAKNRVEITYKQTLEQGVKALKNNNYQVAINHFDLILKTHPKDINALFYGGIASYNLDKFNTAKDKFELVLVHEKTMFNQEAKWYKAKSLIELNEIKLAKKILQQIIDTKGFYKEQATEILKELK